MIKTTIKIDGMSCGMCEAHVNDLIRSNFNVKKVKSSHSNGLAEIITENPINEDSLKDAFKQSGYKISEINSEPYTKKKFLFFNNK